MAATSTLQIRNTRRRLIWALIACLAVGMASCLCFAWPVNRDERGSVVVEFEHPQLARIQIGQSGSFNVDTGIEVGWYGSLLISENDRADELVSPTACVFYVRAKQRLLSGFFRPHSLKLPIEDRNAIVQRLCDEVSGVRVHKNESSFFNFAKPID